MSCGLEKIVDVTRLCINGHSTDARSCILKQANCGIRYTAWTGLHVVNERVREVDKDRDGMSDRGRNLFDFYISNLQPK